MKTFYLRTDKFWNFSQIFFALLFTIAVIIVLLKSDFKPLNLIGYSILGIYIYLMILSFTRRAYKKSIPSKVRITTGILSILIGFLMSYTILSDLNMSGLLKIGFHFLPVWIILTGLRDILLCQDNYVVADK